MKVQLSILFLLFSFQFIQAQEQDSILVEESPLQIYEDTLSIYAYAMVNSANANNRFLAVRSFIPILTKALKEENSFDYPFERLRTVSIQYPQDSTFRIFTWQLYVDSSEYRYYGAIQMNTPDLQLIPLIDRSFTIQNVENEILPNDNWYGSLYYNIKDFDTPEGKKYLLFGYDSFENFERYEENGDRDRALAFAHSDFQNISKRKIIDVLTIKDKKAIFGAPVFVHFDERNRPFVKRNRVLLDYSAEASVSCNYDEFEEMVIFDHLMPMGAVIPGERPINMPDGTYEGYKLQNGQWLHIPKVFNTVVEEAPREQPVFDQEKKDLFGKTKDKN